MVQTISFALRNPHDVPPSERRRSLRTGSLLTGSLWFSLNPGIGIMIFVHVNETADGRWVQRVNLAAAVGTATPQRRLGARRRPQPSTMRREASFEGATIS